MQSSTELSKKQHFLDALLHVARSSMVRIAFVTVCGDRDAD